MLITGAKRDIALLERVEAQPGDAVTVLDISLARNVSALQRLLACGASCRYFDHHFAGEVPAHPNLKTFIDTAPDICTSLIADRYLGGRHRIWAVVAAFGDNLAAAARGAAAPLGVNELQIAQLQALGESINYNAYGESVDDLNYHPADLYQTLSHYADPFEFIVGEPVFEILRTARADDLYLADELKPELETPCCALYVLPDAAWSRRVSGVFANRLAQQHPQRAHAVLTARPGGFVVSVRAPIAAPRGADELCRQFAGGGRQGAAGIDWLPGSELDRFVAALARHYPE